MDENFKVAKRLKIGTKARNLNKLRSMVVVFGFKNENISQEKFIINK